MPIDPDPVSKALFGNGHYLLVGCILRPRTSPFYARELAAETGLADKTIGEILKRMTAAGMLMKLPPADAKQHYEREVTHPMWDALSALESYTSAKRTGGSGASRKPAALRRHVIKA